MWLLQNILKLLLRLLLGLHVRRNLFFLSTTESLIFSLILKALHASSRAYRFLARKSICFNSPMVMKFYGKGEGFKSTISPSFELWSSWMFFEWGIFLERIQICYFFLKILQFFLYLLYKLIGQKKLVLVLIPCRISYKNLNMIACGKSCRFRK